MSITQISDSISTLMNFVSVKSPSVRVTSSREALEFLDAVLRTATAAHLSYGIANQPPETLAESGGLVANMRKKAFGGHAVFHRLIIRELERRGSPRRGKPRLYTCGCSATALCVSIA